MRVAPIDIAHKTFGRKIYGLDTEEVYDFLRDIADEMEEVVRSHNQLEEKLKEKENALGDFKEREESLKQTLQTASQMSERMRAESEKEAELIVKDARQRAEIIIKEARDSLRKMYQEINDLKKSRLQFEAGLKSLIKAHMAMIDQGHTVVPDPSVTESKSTASVEENAPAPTMDV